MSSLFLICPNSILLIPEINDYIPKELSPPPRSLVTNLICGKIWLAVQADSEDEVEVDIDQLSTEVLWKLDRYTKNIVQKVRKKPTQKGPGQQGAKPVVGSQPTIAAEAEPHNGNAGKAGLEDSSGSSSGKRLLRSCTRHCMIFWVGINNKSVSPESWTDGSVIPWRWLHTLLIRAGFFARNPFRQIMRQLAFVYTAWHYLFLLCPTQAPTPYSSPHSLHTEILKVLLSDTLFSCIWPQDVWKIGSCRSICFWEDSFLVEATTKWILK